MNYKVLTGFLSLLLASQAFAQRDIKPGFNLFSKEQDIQLGREAAAQVERQAPVVKDAQIQSYIDSLGRRLASQPQADRFPYTFKAVQDKSINAFALPGGPTYVHTGLIAAADNEAQLIGVMAHEIAHVALRHGTNQASKANLIQLPAALAGAVLGGGGSMLGQLAQMGIGLGANSVLLKYSRNAERDADLLGARMMASLGYNPIEMARFFEKLQAQGGQSGPEFMSDHPNPGNRMKAIQDEIRTLPQRSYNADSGQFQEMKRRVSGFSGTNNEGSGRRSLGSQGATRAPNLRPSGALREYRTRTFTMGIPENWQAFSDTDSAMLTLAPREGLVQGQNGSTAVGYGVVSSYYFPNNQRINLNRDTNALINQLRQQNTSMQAGREGQRRVQVGGTEALLTTMYSQSPYQGDQEVDLLVTVPRPEGLFYMIFIAPQAEFNDVRSQFEQMLGSIRFQQ